MYTIETIKKDMLMLSAEQFYTKYIVCSQNWYLENILKYPQVSYSNISEQYRIIISERLKISVNSIMMVGSGKIGYSLSPFKLFKPFNMDEKVREISDLDIAIISSSIFNKFWRLLKLSYKNQYKELYENHIFREIYRGYISEKNIENIAVCRKIWNEEIAVVKKELMETLYIKNEITFRLYNSWEDFQDYNIQNINKIKRGMKNEI